MDTEERLSRLEESFALALAAERRRSARWRWAATIAGLIALVSLAPLPGRAITEEAAVTLKSLNTRLKKVETKQSTDELSLAVLHTKADPFFNHVSVANGVGTGTEIVVGGANLHVVSGSGATDGAINGLGNLIVGYNELRGDVSDVRTGSHNLIVGALHSYSSYGGVAMGQDHTVSGAYASVTGGRQNTASGFYSSVTGGAVNTATGAYASVTGGYQNTASGGYASVTGGDVNLASGGMSTVCGGVANTAGGSDINGDFTAILGGFEVTVTTKYGHSP